MNDLLVELHPPLAWVRLNRPEKRNAVTSAMWSGLIDLARQFSVPSSTRVILLRGMGTVAFSAGADIAEMEQNLANTMRIKEMAQAVLDAQVAWERIPLPTIAVIQGACTGGGCGLALACDLRLGSPEAFFAIPPAKLGLAYSLADTKRLYNLVGPALTKDILFTGRRINAQEALSLGIINEIVPSALIQKRAIALAEQISRNAENSVRAAKAVVNLISAGINTETPESKRYYDESFSSAEFLEGARAFIKKRSPKF